jgi:hypothetical protein
VSTDKPSLSIAAGNGDSSIVEDGVSWWIISTERSGYISTEQPNSSARRAPGLDRLNGVARALSTNLATIAVLSTLAGNVGAWSLRRTVSSGLGRVAQRSNQIPDGM